MRRIVTAAAVTVLVTGCPGGSAGTTQPDPATGSGAGSVADAPADVGFGPWQASLDADHPLVGTAWSPAEGRTLTRAELEQRLLGARFVLLGETHDHPDHHRLQGAMISALIDGSQGGSQAGQPPAVAYEMLDPAQQAQIDAFTGEPDAFAQLVDWANSGWPEWELYRPAFAPVLAAHLPILAAQFPRSQTKRFMTEGLAMLPAETVQRYGLDAPLPEHIQSAWLDEMFVSHCEMVPREQLTPMVEIQRVRDAVMADAMLRGVETNGRAVLVAGTGHTRAMGVPRLLKLAGIPEQDIVSVGFAAVDDARSQASDYGDEHDVIVLTPGIERDDPCAAMRAQ